MPWTCFVDVSNMSEKLDMFWPNVHRRDTLVVESSCREHLQKRGMLENDLVPYSLSG